MKDFNSCVLTVNYLFNSQEDADFAMNWLKRLTSVVPFLDMNGIDAPYGKVIGAYTNNGSFTKTMISDRRDDKEQKA